MHVFPRCTTAALPTRNCWLSCWLRSLFRRAVWNLYQLPPRNRMLGMRKSKVEWYGMRLTHRHVWWINDCAVDTVVQSNIPIIFVYVYWPIIRFNFTIAILDLPLDCLSRLKHHTPTFQAYITKRGWHSHLPHGPVRSRNKFSPSIVVLYGLCMYNVDYNMIKCDGHFWQYLF